MKRLAADGRWGGGLAPGRQLGLLWGAVAVVLLAASPWAPALAAGLPACPLRSLTGLPCPGCGAGRAALALARLDPAAALAASPLAAAAWTGLVGGGLAAGLAAVAGRGVPEPSPSPAARLAIVAVVLANWGWLLWNGA